MVGVRARVGVGASGVGGGVRVPPPSGLRIRSEVGDSAGAVETEDLGVPRAGRPLLGVVVAEVHVASPLLVQARQPLRPLLVPAHLQSDTESHDRVADVLTTTSLPNTVLPTKHILIEHKPTEHKPTEHKPTEHRFTEHEPTEHELTEHGPTDHELTEHSLIEHEPTELEPDCEHRVGSLDSPP
eukprot:391808-Prorocentrum_minimum.AAC.1